MKTIKVRQGWYRIPNTGWFVVYDSTLDGELKWVVGNDKFNRVMEFCEEWDQMYYTKKEAVARISDFINGER